MNINQSIQHLLHEHECVIIPQFGGFVTNYKASFVHPKKQIVFPPSKQVSFNVNLTNNDGLLANYISQSENVSYEVAMDYVKTQVSNFSAELTEKSRISLEGIGVISKNTSGSLEFAPENTHNFLRNAFGLKPVFLPTLAELAPEEIVVEPIVVPAKETPVIPIAVNTETEEKPATKRVNRKWLAAAVFLPLMFFGGMAVQNNSTHLSSLLGGILPSSFTSEADYVPRIEGEKIQFTYEEPVNQLKLIAEQNPELQSVIYSFRKAEISPDGLKVLLSSEAPEVNPASTSFERGSSSFELYFIVAGCFQDKINADGLVNKLKRKGYDAGIFGKKGTLHMVCYGSYTSRTSAEDALHKLKQLENPGAWIKKH